MRVHHVLVFVVLAAVSVSRGDAVSTGPERVKQAKLAPPDTITWAQRFVRNKRNLRAHNTRKAEDDDNKGGEERVAWGEAVSLLQDAALKAQLKVKLEAWLALRFKPDQVLEMLQVTSTKDENYKKYSKYFYDFFVRYLDEPMSHLHPQIIENIWQARLYYWLQTDSPPQVFAKLGLTGSFASAKGQKNYDIFEEFYKRWAKKQLKESTRPKLDIVVRQN
ncbi:hypothetical protein PC129_g16139 [Phytophthora cactorum]|uniref:RxLR effector protein n=1 Tax=Phytophthora cactorum TaxID=29920 RepID=A0A329RNW1_9STRA|nr:hypothetical protein GQ600_1243 [Phytophthora cactorum]KAG2770906.1 hypothetical protein Pcac1_g18127 [Phytophthora cactorum]KAG2811807.1 hypothetical protein PC112_g15451 [Phytophthora cactorum]KAG2819583.1 hypothetical protein PC111_g11836 [Phytophthora cactorum]KAG2857695.1 hypothetical protein PC113_g10470 [Phytophthora cactorum]